MGVYGMCVGGSRGQNEVPDLITQMTNRDEAGRSAWRQKKQTHPHNGGVDVGLTADLRTPRTLITGGLAGGTARLSGKGVVVKM